MNKQKVRVQDGPPREWYRYDLCLVLRVHRRSGAIHRDSAAVVRRIAQLVGRTHVYIYYAADASKAYLLVRAGMKLLRLKAVSEKWSFPVDPQLLEQHYPDIFQRIAELEPTLFSKFSRNECIYLPYDEALDSSFVRSGTAAHPFHKTVRLRMLLHQLGNASQDYASALSTTSLSAAALKTTTETVDGVVFALPVNPESLCNQHILENAFAIHDFAERNEIVKQILHWQPMWQTPLNVLQSYFGEKIAMYFAFVDFFSRGILPVTCAGIAAQVLYIYYDDKTLSRPEVPAFSFCLALGCVVVVHRWARRQQLLSKEWNAHETTAREDEVLQALYCQSLAFNHNPFCYFRLVQKLLSAVVVIVCCAGWLLGMAAIYYYVRVLLRNTIVSPYEQWVVSGGVALGAAVVSRIFALIAWEVTEWEAHRTADGFETALALKVVLFDCIAVLSTCGYIAFGARYVHTHHPVDSYFALTQTVLCIASIECLVRISTQWALKAVLNSCFRNVCGWYTVREPSVQQLYNLQGGRAPAASTAAEDVGREQYSHRQQPSSNVQGGDVDDDTSHDGAGSSLSAESDVDLESQQKQSQSHAQTRTSELHPSDDEAEVNDGDEDSQENESESVLGAPVAFSNTQHAFHMRQQRRPSDSEHRSVASRLSARSQSTLRQHLAATQRNDISAVDSAATHGPQHDENLYDGYAEPELAETVNTVRAQLAAKHQQLRKYSPQTTEGGVEMTRRSPVASGPSNMYWDNYQQNAERARQEQSAIEADAASDDDHAEQSREGTSTLDPFYSVGHLRYDSTWERLFAFSHFVRLFILALAFGGALPGVFMIFIFYGYFETRGHCFNICYYFPRALPEGCQSLQIWDSALPAVLSLGVVINAAFVVLCTHPFRNWSMLLQLAIWIGQVAALFLLQYILCVHFHKQPHAIAVHRQQQTALAVQLRNEHPSHTGGIAVEML